MKLIAYIFHDVLARQASGFSGPDADWYKISVARFEKLLDAILEAAVFPPEKLSGATKAMPEGNVTLLTFDDGGASAIDPTATILEGRGLRGRFFVVSGLLGKRGFLTAAQCRELVSRGHLLGSHSLSHPGVFSRLPRKEQLRQWSVSRTQLEQALGMPVVTAAVPGGYFSWRVAATAGEAGYKVLFTNEPLMRVAHSERGMLVVGRYMLTRGSSASELAALARHSHAARISRWLGWNTKKIAKAATGPAYHRVRNYILERRLRLLDKAANR